jgi:hypothetical protein
MNEIFEYNNKFYFIKRNKFEIREIYIERVWFILTNNKLNNTSFEKIELESFKWANKKFLECDY